MSGNKLTKIGKKSTIEIFQKVAYQILFGTYIPNKWKCVGCVHHFVYLHDAFPKDIDLLYGWNINYYSISEDECSSTIKFLNGDLEIVCEVTTKPEEDTF